MVSGRGGLLWQFYGFAVGVDVRLLRSGAEGPTVWLRGSPSTTYDPAGGAHSSVAASIGRPGRSLHCGQDARTLPEARVIRVALIDDDSGLVTVLDRRFAALRWERELLGYGAVPEQLTSMRLHALVVNPALTGLDYIEWTARALPGLALLVCGPPAPVADRVRALRSGADDWITKPCHPEELVARIEAVLRRRRVGELPVEDAALYAGELSIRPDRFDVYADGRPASLSRKEYELLYQLAAADGRVLEREDIYQRVWGYTMARGDRSVDVFVRKLRQKLELVSPGWRYVHTHFGVGYRFAPEGPHGSQPEPPGEAYERQEPATAPRATGAARLR
jgi:DNA-binding response OmpR family regulator